MPSFGFAVGNLMFIIALPTDTDEEIEYFSNERNRWTLILFIIVVFPVSCDFVFVGVTWGAVVCGHDG